MRLSLPTLLLAAALPALAQAPADYQRAWPVLGARGEPALFVDLDAEVLGGVTRPDLRDLAAYNADGQPVPFAPMPRREATRAVAEPLRWLRVPPEANDDGTASAGDELRLVRDEDGRVREITVAPGSAPAEGQPADLVVDLGEDAGPVSSITITPADAARGRVQLRLAVSASGDLSYWRPVGQGLALVSLQDNGLRIERLDIRFEPAYERFLRLSLESGGDWPALAGISRERLEDAGEPPPRRELLLAGEAVPGDPGVFTYRTPAFVAIDRADVHLPQDNTVAAVTLEHRDGAEAPWRQAAAFTAFRLGDGGTATHAAVDLAPTRDREWRLRTEPALPVAPMLWLQYSPDRFVLLAQGPGPYRVVAGSARATRPDYPVEAALAAARGDREDSWQPAVALLGPGEELGGAAALEPARNADWMRWLLWAVLALGAGLVLVVSLRVLRHPPAE